jgi:hypothetical protein
MHTCGTNEGQYPIADGLQVITPTHSDHTRDMIHSCLQNNSEDNKGV